MLGLRRTPPTRRPLTLREALTTLIDSMVVVAFAFAFVLAFGAIHNAAHNNKASATTNTLGVYICGDIICTTTSGVTSSKQLYAHEHIAKIQEHMQ